MFSPLLIIAILSGYMLLLLALAGWVERRGGAATALADSRWVYALGLAVYCSSWTYYGSVGVAARSGFLFLAIYLGPTLVWLFGWTLMRQLARFRAAHRVTNLGDLLSARYGHSAALAALATVLAVVALNPYIGLQFKAILTTFDYMVRDDLARHWPGSGPAFEVFVVGFVVMVTALFGLRHLDPGQRQRGVMVVLAAESLVKLAAFVAVGIFATYGMHDGIADITARVAALPDAGGLRHDGNAQWYFTFVTWLLLSMAAAVFLPRQFHVGVVELPRVGHLRTAMWFFPLYLLLINFFVYPIAAVGLLTGHSVAEADSFVLTLPLQHGSPGVALLALVGGFSAAVGMIMISALTLSVMVANHLVMPLAERLSRLRGLRRRVLAVRWAAAACIVVAGYLFGRQVGASHFLAAMGLISFAGVAQFAPAVLGGLVWSKASRSGAVWGLTAGFALWVYTLFLPALARSGWWLPAEFVGEGPFGFALLRPEALFGIEGLQPLAHGLFWSLSVNVVLFVLGSCWKPAAAEERDAVQVALDEPSVRTSSMPHNIALAPKIECLRGVLAEYLPPREVEAAIAASLAKIEVRDRREVSPLELVRFLGEAEKALAAAIGAATAHVAMREGGLVTAQESRDIARLYSRILADLQLSPEELRRRVDFYHDRNETLNRHAAELSEKLDELKCEIAARTQAENALRESEKRFRSMADSAPVMIWIAEADGDRSYFNQSWLAFTGREPAREMRRGWFDGMAVEDRDAWRQVVSAAVAGRQAYSVEYRLRRGDGSYRWVAEHATPRVSADGALLGFIGSCVDISEMKAAAEALRRSRDELEELVAQRTAELRRANDALTDEVGQRRRAEESLRASYAELKETNGKLAEAQNQLLQSEKMASIGQLAAGVAHEINNPIGFVNSNLGTLWEYLEDLLRLLDAYRAAEARIGDAAALAAIRRLQQAIDLDFLREDIPKIRHETMDGIDRVRRIVQDLKEFSHVDESHWQEADLHAGLDSTLNVVWNELKYKAQVVKEYGSLPRVHCIPSQLNQVFMNLFVNAAQAIAERGTITIRTGCEDDWVWVEVADTGRGIAPENLNRIFEPFFTTKPVGQGTGLGLSVSYGIVSKHGGRIEVASELGVGTRFRVWLPVAPVLEAEPLPA